MSGSVRELRPCEPPHSYQAQRSACQPGQAVGRSAQVTCSLGPGRRPWPPRTRAGPPTATAACLPSCRPCACRVLHFDIKRRHLPFRVVSGAPVWAPGSAHTRASGGADCSSVACSLPVAACRCGRRGPRRRAVCSARGGLPLAPACRVCSRGGRARLRPHPASRSLRVVQLSVRVDSVCRPSLFPVRLIFFFHVYFPARCCLYFHLIFFLFFFFTLWLI